jgi:hypothetical protein
LNKTGRFKYLVLLLLLISLFPYLYISFYANPIADDYCNANWSMGKTFWENFTYLFLYIGGRYSANTLFYFHPLAYHSLKAYKLAPASLIIMTIFSFYYFFRSITSRLFSKINSWNASILFVLLYLFQMPSLAQGIYFYNSACVYQMGLIVSMLYFGLLYEYYCGKFTFNKAVHLFLLAITLIACVGFNEVLTLVLLCFHYLILFLLKEQEKKIGADWIFIVSICTLASLVMLFAPGNFLRSTHYPDNHNFLRSIVFTGMQMARFGFSWVVSAPLILSSLLFAHIIISKKENIPFFRQRYFFKPWQSVLLLFAILFLCIFPAYWSTNILGQHRTVNVGCFLFLLFGCVCIGIYSIAYLEKIKQYFIVSQKGQLLILLLLLGTMATTNNEYAVLTDILSGRIKRFDFEMQERYAVLETVADKSKPVHIKELTEKPASLFVLDLSSDSTYWVNIAQAQYFGVKSIVCEK